MFEIPATVRAVIFDAVGTLLRPEPSVVESYEAVARRFGVELPHAEVEARFCEAFARQEVLDSSSAGHLTSKARERDRWRHIVGEVFPDAADGAGLFAALWDHFAQPRHWRLFDDAAAAWRALEARGFALGVASNFDARLEQICAGLPPLAGCRNVFASSRLGFRKPSAQFFRAIERALHLQPGQILLVGDDLRNDYLAARAAGWHAVLVLRGQPAPPEADCAIDTLAELHAQP